MYEWNRRVEIYNKNLKQADITSDEKDHFRVMEITGTRNWHSLVQAGIRLLSSRVTNSNVFPRTGMS